MNWTIVFVSIMSGLVTGYGVYQSCIRHSQSLPAVLLVDAFVLIVYALIFGFTFSW